MAAGRDTASVLRELGITQAGMKALQEAGDVEIAPTGNLRTSKL